MRDSIFLQAPSLAEAGFCHGFGQAPMPFASEAGEAFKADSVAAAGESARAAAEAPAAPIVTLKQIHSRHALIIRAADRYVPPPDTIRADALISDHPGLILAVKTADCMPVLALDPATGVVAAIHAGWRGTEANIVGHTLRRMAEVFGMRTDDVRLAFGPCAGPCCYEVSEELAARFSLRYGPSVLGERAGKPTLNLAAINHAQAVRAGVRPERISHVAACTICTPSFYSYRREGAATGRLFNFIMRRANGERVTRRPAGLSAAACLED